MSLITRRSSTICALRLQMRMMCLDMGSSIHTHDLGGSEANDEPLEYNYIRVAIQELTSAGSKHKLSLNTLPKQLITFRLAFSIYGADKPNILSPDPWVGLAVRISPTSILEPRCDKHNILAKRWHAIVVSQPSASGGRDMVDPMPDSDIGYSVEKCTVEGVGGFKRLCSIRWGILVNSRTHVDGIIMNNKHLAYTRPCRESNRYPYTMTRGMPPSVISSSSAP
ncbi:hypothetical protein Tco_0495847 [Tanacetum coccineum]